MRPDPKLAQAVARVLGRLRKRRKLSQEKLAERSGLSANYVSKLENGRCQVSFAALTLLAEGLNLPATVLVRIIIREYKR